MAQCAEETDSFKPAEVLEEDQHGRIRSTRFSAVCIVSKD
jgi:hypothetical protein